MNKYLPSKQGREPQRSSPPPGSGGQGHTVPPRALGVTNTGDKVGRRAVRARHQAGTSFRHTLTCYSQCPWSRITERCLLLQPNTRTHTWPLLSGQQRPAPTRCCPPLWAMRTGQPAGPAPAGASPLRGPAQPCGWLCLPCCRGP